MDHQYLLQFMATMRGDKVVTQALEKMEKGQNKLNHSSIKGQLVSRKYTKTLDDQGAVLKRVTTSVYKTHKGYMQQVKSVDKLGKATYKYSKVAKPIPKLNRSMAASMMNLAKRALMVAPIWMLMRGAIMMVTSTIRDVIQANMDFQVQLARIKTVVSGSSKSIESDMTSIRQVILDTSATSTASLKDLAEAFYFLRTSNLSTEEAIAAFKPSVDLAIGTLSKLGETARTVAGIYATIGKRMGENMTLTQKFTKIADGLAYTYACYTPDTEVLTNKGWKLFTDLDKTETIATLNPKTKELEYQKPTEYVDLPFDGKLCHLKGRFADIKVTPTHKLYTQLGYRPVKKEYVLAEAKDVFGRPKTFYRGCNWNGESPEHFILPSIENGNFSGKEMKIPIKTWIRLLGWYLSEGSCFWQKTDKNTSYRITIYQSKKSKHWNDLTEVMSLIPFKATEFDRGFTINSKQLCFYLKQFGLSRKKYIPDFIKGLSKDLLRLFIKTYAYGDGSFKKHSFSIATGSDKMKNDFHEIALKADYGSTILWRKGGPRVICGVKTQSKGTWIISFTERTEFLMYPKKNQYYADKENRKTDSKEEWIDYKGRVVCVEVPNHIIFVRRKGKSFWCGNTQEVQMSELLQSYIKIAPYLGGLKESWSEIVTILGFLNTKQLKAGRTGRLLGRSILQIVKNSKQLAHIFGITFSKDEPIAFLAILKKINEAMGGGASTAGQREKLFKVFATRGQVPVSLLIQDFKEMEDAIAAAGVGMDGFAKKMSKIMQKTVPAQMQRTKNILAVLSNEFFSAAAGGGDFVGVLVKMNDSLEGIRKQLKETGLFIGWLVDNITKLNKIADKFGIKKIGFELVVPQLAGIGLLADIVKNMALPSDLTSYDEYLEKQKEGAKLTKDRIDLQAKIKSFTKDMAKSRSLDMLKAEQIIQKSIITLMKKRGSTELEIAEYKIKSFSETAMWMENEEKYAKQLSLINDKINAKYSERIKETKTLMSHHQKLHTMFGADSEAAAKLNYEIQKMLFGENDITRTLKAKLELEKEILKTKHGQYKYTSDEAKIYKIYKKYGYDSAREMARVAAGRKAPSQVTEKRQFILKEFFPEKIFAEEMKRFSGGIGKSIMDLFQIQSKESGTQALQEAAKLKELYTTAPVSEKQIRMEISKLTLPQPMDVKVTAEVKVDVNREQLTEDISRIIKESIDNELKDNVTLNFLRDHV